MKKILSYILIMLILSANFLVPISVGFNGGKNIDIKKNITEAADCQFISVNIAPATNLSQTTPDFLSLDIETSPDCINQIFSGKIQENSSGTLPNLTFLNQTITANKFSIGIKPGEKNCFGNTVTACKSDLTLTISDTNSNTLDKYTSKTGGGNGGTDVFYYKCKGVKCDSSNKWEIIKTSGTNEEIGLFTMIPSADKNSITVKGEGPKIINDVDITDKDEVIVGIYDSTGTQLITSAKICDTADLTKCTSSNPITYLVKSQLISGNSITYSTTFSGLTPKTSYTVKLTADFLNMPSLRDKMFILDGIYTLDELGQIVQELPKGLTNRATCKLSIMFCLFRLHIYLLLREQCLIILLIILCKIPHINQAS
ncbi:MAG: hypothetical protein NTV03_00360 [Candidatus Nomurabacteria bacterium]|nr:hypothetical protein [Candidatus Nomurabacteria bacterium]